MFSAIMSTVAWSHQMLDLLYLSATEMLALGSITFSLLVVGSFLLALRYWKRVGFDPPRAVATLKIGPNPTYTVRVTIQEWTKFSVNILISMCWFFELGSLFIKPPARGRGVADHLTSEYATARTCGLDLVDDERQSHETVE